MDAPTDSTSGLFIFYICYFCKMIDTLTEEIDRAVREFTDGLPAIQKKIYASLLDELKGLKLYSDGSIKNNYENIRKIARIKKTLKDIILNKPYLIKVNGFVDAYESVEKIQNIYFGKLSADFTPKKVLEEVKKQSVDDVVEMLTENGINANIAEPIRQIIKTNITSGGSYAELTEQLRDKILGTKDLDGSLVKYSSQITTDAINQYSATYIKVVTDDLGLKWFRYTGSLLKTSRPFCIAMVAKSYVHESEFPEILKGNIDGKKVSLAGLNANTTPANFQILRGGWNCSHQLIPISAVSVPQNIKDKIK